MGLIYTGARFSGVYNILLSADGGVSWSPSYSGSRINGFVDIGSGVAYGLGNDRVIKTIDGGSSWNTITTTIPYSTSSFRRIAVTDVATDTFVLCDGSSIYRTTDEFATITSVQSITWNYSPLSAYSAVINLGGGVVLSSSLFRSTDYGATWSPMALPLGPVMTFSGEGPYIGDVGNVTAFMDMGGGRVFAFGQMNSDIPVDEFPLGVIWISDDYGASWSFNFVFLSYDGLCYPDATQMDSSSIIAYGTQIIEDVYSEDNAVFKCTNALDPTPTWSFTTDPYFAFGTEIFYDPDTARLIFLDTLSDFKYSTDLGLSWTTYSAPYGFSERAYFLISGSEVPPVPVADFSGTPTSGDADLLVSFTDLSASSPTSWSWDFGDGGTSTSQNPTHLYTQAGVYTVSLEVSNAFGTDTETKTDYITVNMAADFVATPLEGYDPATISFTDLTKGGPTNWLWDFGDGTTSSVQNPIHKYLSAGYFTIKLIAWRGSFQDEEQKYNYISIHFTDSVVRYGYVVVYPVLYTIDLAPPEDRLDLRQMYAAGSGNFLERQEGGIKTSIRLDQVNPLDTGFRRPQGPTLIFE